MTKSGTNELQSLGLVQRPPGPVQRERLLPRVGGAPEAALSRQHLRLQRRRAGRDPGSSTAGKSARKLYFFVAQEYTDDARPTTTSRANMPTALEDNGDFSQTKGHRPGTIQQIIDPLTGLAVSEQL